MSRVKYVAKNIAFGYIGNLISTIMGFVLRTVFIMKLDITLLGVDGLYGSVLTVLSLAELGIGTAMNYSLYAPVAAGNREKIKSYMQLYKKAYLSIAGIVTVIGIAIAPFLKYIIKEPGVLTTRELTIYYFIFLFNTVSTYFVAYKYSLVNAEQKNYIQTNIITITRLVTTVLQVIVILLTQSFLVYLLTAAIVELLQKIFANHYLNRLYPYLKEKNVRKLTQEETRPIIENTKALVYHKVGDVARLQTDNIIISTFINVALVGYISNYNMVLTAVSGFVNIIFNSVMSSFGNLIATESKEKQYQMFRVYKFLAAWIYGLSAIGFFYLLSPFIQICWGESMVLGSTIVFCILTDYYFKGLRIVQSNFKTAAGVFAADKYLALIQGAVNLVISIVLVQWIGLVGVYIGTIISGLIGNFVRPYLIYQICFEKKVISYYLESARYLLVLLLSAGVMYPISAYFLKDIKISGILIVFMLIMMIVNLIYYLFFHKEEEFKYLLSVIRRRKQ